MCEYMDCYQEFNEGAVNEMIDSKNKESIKLYFLFTMQIPH